MAHNLTDAEFGCVVGHEAWGRLPRWYDTVPKTLEALFDLHDLAAAIHTGLQIDMVRTVQFAGGLVFHIGFALEGIVSPTYVALGARDLGLWNGHRSSLVSTCMCPEPAGFGRQISARQNRRGCVGETPYAVKPIHRSGSSRKRG